MTTTLDLMTAALGLQTCHSTAPAPPDAEWEALRQWSNAEGCNATSSQLIIAYSIASAMPLGPTPEPMEQASADGCFGTGLVRFHRHAAAVLDCFDEQFDVSPPRRIETELIPTRYAGVGDPSVLQHLRDYPAVAGYMHRADSWVLQHFGPSAAVSLETILCDEESSELELVAWITTDMAASEALERLSGLEEDLDREVTDTTAGQFNYNVRLA